ncbi:uncharacterized protein LOC113331533 [Papaver somniferum]|uniref:uncharacterized protein LOC113331533 n=1 Tax=Papaver somniferum TaxID=3469 RepID=UPI000E6FB93B|nr:uncharacterized protein LOC113331533 [Papaver somniferum]
MDLTTKLKYWYYAEEDFWRQRGKGDAILLDDRNTTYFHQKANFRRQKTQIESLQNNMGIWLDERRDIKNELLRHFSNMSRTTHPPNSDAFLSNIETCINDQDNSMLIAMPSCDEIKKVVFEMKPWTTPIPDGFPPGSYQLMWDTVGPEVVKMVQSFFHSHYILKQLNHNFTTLIPKSNCPKNAADFRPIRLCNVSYKIISKLLASRLKKVLQKIISPAQTAFISGKVYYPQRGLRQGDPLSPYLFILYMEALSRGLIQAENDNLIHGFKANKHFPSISHLFFADDCLIFIKARTKDARNLVTLIEKFSKFSGQAVNFENSALAFSILAHWKPTYLAPLGRTVMDQSVLGSLASHHLAVFPMPKEITDKLDNLQMRFWWGKKEEEKGCYTKGWKDIALPKELGCLNIRRTDVLNLALLTKLAWRLLENPDDKWTAILRGKYFADSNPLCDSVSKQVLGSGMVFSKKVRCAKYFDNVQPNVDNIANSIMMQMNDWINARLVQPNANYVITQSQHYWTPPLNNCIKINFDASFVNNNTFSGWALISRNFSGDCDGLRGGAAHAIDPEQAEVQALLEAVLWAKQKGLTKLQLEGDCLNVINAVNGSLTAVKWTTHNLIKAALGILSSFSFWSCTYVHRDANHIADSLAKFARSHTICFQYYNDIPAWVQTLIQQDKTLM